MGDAAASQETPSKRISDEVDHGRDTSGPFETSDLNGETFKNGGAHGDRRSEPLAPTRRPQTADYTYSDAWNVDGDGALKRRTSWDGSALSHRDAHEPAKINPELDSRPFVSSVHDFHPTEDDVADMVTARRPITEHDPSSVQGDWLATDHTQAPYPSQSDNVNGSSDMHSLIGHNTGLQEAERADERGDVYGVNGGPAPEQEEWIDLGPYQPPEPQDEGIPDPFAPAPDLEAATAARADEVIPDPFHSPVQDKYSDHPEQRQVQPESPPPPPPPHVVPPAGLETTAEPSSHPTAESSTLHESAPELDDRIVDPELPDDIVKGDGFGKLLRKLRKNIDDILENRTRWQNEQQKLERLRAFYKQSIKGMIASIEKDRAPDQADEVQLDDSRERGSRGGRRRADVDIGGSQTTGLPISEGSGRDSRAATTSSSRGLGDTTTSLSFANFEEAREQVQKDEEALDEQEAKVKILVGQINNLEFYVKELIQDITKQMTSDTFIDELRIDALNVDEPSEDSEPKAVPEDDTPELVRQYFDWMGERHINLERLQELDYNHQEGLVQRDFLRDQGRDLGVSDEEYLLNYQSHREDITKRLDEAREKVAQKLKLCEEAGLDPELYRKVARTQYTGDASQESRSIRVDLRDLALQQDHDIMPPRSISPPHEGSKLRHIEGWLRNVSHGQSEPVPAVSGLESPPNGPP